LQSKKNDSITNANVFGEKKKKKYCILIMWNVRIPNVF